MNLKIARPIMSLKNVLKRLIFLNHLLDVRNLLGPYLIGVKMRMDCLSVMLYSAMIWNYHQISHLLLWTGK